MSKAKKQARKEQRKFRKARLSALKKAAAVLEQYRLIAFLANNQALSSKSRCRMQELQHNPQAVG